MNNNQMNNQTNRNINNRSTTPNQRGGAPNRSAPSNFNNQINNNFNQVPYNRGFNPELDTPNNIQVGSNLNNQPTKGQNPIPNRVGTKATRVPQGARRNPPSIDSGKNDLRPKANNNQPSKINKNKDNIPRALKNRNRSHILRSFLGNPFDNENSDSDNDNNNNDIEDKNSDSNDEDVKDENEPSVEESIEGTVSGVGKILLLIKSLPIIVFGGGILVIVLLIAILFSEPTLIISPFLGLNSSNSDNPFYVYNTGDKQQQEKEYYAKINSTITKFTSDYGVYLDKYLLNATLLYRFYSSTADVENSNEVDFKLASNRIEEVANLMVTENNGSYSTDFKENGTFYNKLVNSSFLASYYKDVLGNDTSVANKEKLVKNIFEFSEIARQLLEKNTNQAFLGDSMRIFLQTCKQKYSTFINERGKKVFSNDRNINAGTNYPEYFSMTEYLKGAVEGELGRDSLNEAEKEGVKAFTVATLTYMLGSFNVDFYPGVQDINFPTGNCRLVSCDVKNGCTYANRGDEFGTAYSGLKRFGITAGNHRPWNEAQNKFMDDVLAEIYGVVMVQKGVTAETFTSGDQLKGGNYYQNMSYCHGGDCMGQTEALADSRNGMTYEQILNKYYSNFDLINIREGLYYETTNNYNGQVNLNEEYHYLQTDYKGANSFCEGGTISASGCSVASTAIAVSLLTNQRITPLDVSNKLKEVGKCTGSGSRYTYPISAAKEYGLSAYSVNKNDTTTINKMLSDLASGHSVVVARIAPNSGQGARYSTDSGHYIALVGVKTEGGKTKVLVWDPATRNASRDNYWADFATDIAKWVNNPAFMVLSNN